MGLPRIQPPPPRQKVYVDTMGKALRRASRLRPSEVADTMAPAHACVELLREGRAAEDHLIILRTQLRIAMAIEDSGVVRGLRAQFERALAAVDAIAGRSGSDAAWRQSALYDQELADIREGVRWHAFQLQHVSAGELHAAASKLIAQTQSSGGELRICSAIPLGQPTSA